VRPERELGEHDAHGGAGSDQQQRVEVDDRAVHVDQPVDPADGERRDRPAAEHGRGRVESELARMPVIQ
jgi:hypothetical protein